MDDFTPLVRGPVSSDDPKPKPGTPKELTIPPPHESVFRYKNKRKEKPINRNAWWRVLLRIIFSHVGLFVLVSLYAVAGAYAFIAIEKPYEDEQFELKKLRYLEVNDSILYMAEMFWYYHGENMSAEGWKDRVWVDLKKLEQYIIESMDERAYDGQYDTWNRKWTFENTLLFTISIMSTIGYGHIAPATHMGRIFCVFYSLLGIPLLLLFLANIGDVMARAFTYSYSRVCCHWCRIRRKKSEYRRGDETIVVPKLSLQSVTKEKVGPEHYMPTDDVMVPIVLNLLLIGAYIMAGAYLFHNWEDWDMISSGYFTFITLATIGFGDLVPGKSFNAHEDRDEDTELNKMIRLFAVSLYCAIGLAIISMCISLMQEQIVKKVESVGKEIGLVGRNKAGANDGSAFRTDKN